MSRAPRPLLDLLFRPVLRPAGVERPVPVQPAVGVGPEVVAQPLQEVGRAARSGGSRRSTPGRRRRRAPGRRAPRPGRPPGARTPAPSTTASRKYGASSRLASAGSPCVGLLDPVEEAGADDAAAAPDGGDGPHVQRPAVLGGGGGELLEALGVGHHLGGVEGPADRLDRSADPGAPDPCPGCPDQSRPGPGKTPAARTRSALRAERERAKTASVIAVTGTPRSSADCDVQRPVPFCSASSRMTSTRGCPVAASTLLSTSAVISIRYEFSSPWFHSRKMAASSAAPRPRAWLSRS